MPAQASPNGKARDIEVHEAKPKPRTLGQIETDLGETRERLVQTLGELQTALKPGNIAKRQARKVRDFYIDDEGEVRVDRVAGTAAVLVSLVAVRRAWKRARR